MIRAKEDVEKLSELFIQLIFMDEDFQYIEHFMWEDITLVDMQDYDEVIVQSQLPKRLEEMVHRYALDNLVLEKHHVSLMNKETAYTTAMFTTPLEEQTRMLQVSMIWVCMKNLWKLKHIHCSLIKKDKDLYEEKLRFEQNLQHVRTTDMLTQLYNLVGFEQEAKEHIRTHADTSYVMVRFGIKDFRFINRKYGYEMGDQVLKNIAKNLQKSLHEDECCGRIEKDNYVMLYRFSTKEAFDERMTRVRLKLLDTNILRKLNMEIQMTAGIYIIKDNRQEDIKDILDKALLAQRNISKLKQGSQFNYYDDEMMDRQYYISQILEEAPKAMEHKEFQLYIQPQFDIHSKEVVAGEALIRWIDEQGEMRMPDDFIPVFEEFGIIFSLDFYMLELLCASLRRWIDKGITILPISINQSRLHIDEESYFHDFCSVIDRYQIPHEYIAFELTESAFVENSEKVIKLANNLHKEDYTVMIDDFGTGYASMSLLTTISANVIKIDKSLLTESEVNPRSKIVIEKVIELAHTMDMTVICEGIESEGQLEFLRESNCDIGQGFLVGKPIEAEQFKEVWLLDNM